MRIITITVPRGITLDDYARSIGYQFRYNPHRKVWFAMRETVFGLVSRGRGINRREALEAALTRGERSVA